MSGAKTNKLCFKASLAAVSRVISRTPNFTNLKARFKCSYWSLRKTQTGPKSRSRCSQPSLVSQRVRSTSGRGTKRRSSSPLRALTSWGLTHSSSRPSRYLRQKSKTKMEALDRRRSRETSSEATAARGGAQLKIRKDPKVQAKRASLVIALRQTQRTISASCLGLTSTSKPLIS